MDLIERSALLKDLEDLKKSPWYNIDNPFIQQGMRECMDMIETQCIKKAPAVDAIPISWLENFRDGLDTLSESQLMRAIDLIIDAYRVEKKREEE